MTNQAKQIFSKYKWGIIAGVAVVVISTISLFSRPKSPEVALWKVERVQSTA